MADLSSLGALTRLRVNMFLREPEAVFWTFCFPLILAVVLGVAFRSEETVETPIAVVVDSPEGQALADRFGGLPGLEVLTYESAAEAQRALRRARVDALVQPGANAPDVSFYPGRAEGEVARLRILRVLDGRPDDPGVVSASQTPLDQRGTRYLDFLFPGLIGMNLMGTGIWGVGFALAEMRQKKLIRRFLVTPMPRSNFLLSFVTARIAFLALELGVLVTFGALVLDVPLDGSIVALMVLALVSGLSFSGLGLLVASRARTLEGVSGIMNLVMMPMWLASGVFFSYERFPEVIQPVLKLLPLTAVNDGLRAVMLEGGGLESIGGPLVTVAAWGLLSFAVALRIFRWE